MAPTTHQNWTAYPPIHFGFIAAVAGIVSHLGFFRRGEHHLYPERYLAAFLASCAASGFILNRNGYTIGQSAEAVFTYAAYYLAGLYSSLILYRALFHPLRKFPGPFPARISSLWWSLKIGTGSDAYKKLTALHEKYGQYVRIGSSDLSISDPHAVQAIYGFGTKCRKAVWYDQDYPLISMHTTRTRDLHDKRRRVWGPAFSDKALRGYETRIRRYSDALVSNLEGTRGRPVDVTKWFNLFAYDVMGDLAFGKDFGMLETGKEHFAISLLNEGMQAQAPMMPAWLFRLLVSIPGLTAGYWKFINYCNQQLNQRISMKPEMPDIMSALLEPFGNSLPKAEDVPMLGGDSRLIIVAGSDTTSATLVHIFYHLAKDPSQVQKLRAELTHHINADGTVKHADIQKAEHLNGVINEALRLHPAVPSGLQRLTPPEGMQIGDVYIPGNITVFTPQYALGRSESVYANASEFVPERWYSKPEMIKHNGAFAPFSIGVYGCIGKPLAYLELRQIVTKLVMTFDIAFAPGEDGTKLLEEARDHFTFESGPLSLVFKERAS